ncbi:MULTISPECIES: hypothetical protein [unclassified Streptomyces]|uniref:hypothetical protein n=1 Tax=unclassified Streptomyces TaxID=2593676 RepID=UPI00364CC938
MFRGTTARTRIPFPAAVLVALLLFAPAASFAFAHTSRDAMANAHPGTTLSGAAPYDERAGCHDGGRSADAHDAARVRDRHRTTATPPPDPPGRPLARTEAATSGRHSDHRSRPSTDHSPAALQVFRC